MTYFKELSVTILLLLLVNNFGFAQIDSTNTDKKWDSALPLFAEWVLQQGVDLPKPFGVSAFFTYMMRDNIRC